MKLTSRGFTLVELMIVIAIIGILVAALFPSFQGYLARSRDSARVQAVSQINTAVSSYNSNTNSLPPSGSGGASCVSTGALLSFMTTFPVDPSGSAHANGGCAITYGYGTGVNSNGVPMAVISAALEGGNTAGNEGSGLSLYQGNTVASGDLLYATAPIKGTGSGYILSR